MNGFFKKLVLGVAQPTACRSARPGSSRRLKDEMKQSWEEGYCGGGRECEGDGRDLRTGRGAASSANPGFSRKFSLGNFGESARPSCPFGGLRNCLLRSRNVRKSHIPSGSESFDHNWTVIVIGHPPSALHLSTLKKIKQ